MPRPCNALGCSLHATGYSTYCQRHKQAHRRHGAPLQTRVSAAELQPYEARINARRTTNPTNQAWAILGDRWMHLLANANAVSAAHRTGQPMNRHRVQAAHHLLQIAGHRATWDVVRCVLAMYLLLGDQPHRFISDRAFDTQLVRRFIRLAPVNAVRYADQRTGRVKRVYRDLPPRVTQVIAATLKAAFGGSGVALALRDQEEQAKRRTDGIRLSNALGEMQ